MHRYCLACVLMQREENEGFSEKLGFEPGPWKSGLKQHMFVMLYAPLLSSVRAGATRRETKRC